MIAGIPIWVFAVMAFIFFSGVMAFRAMHAERKLEQQFIEKEGNTYIERMEAERAERMQGGQAGEL